MPGANVLLLVTAEAAVQNFNLLPLNNSEVRATWDVNSDLFELSFFNVSCFIKPEQQETETVTVNTYQISDLIPGETYTVQVTAYYNGTPADTTEVTVTLDKLVCRSSFLNVDTYMHRSSFQLCSIDALSSKIQVLCKHFEHVGNN